jgi:hypothetical protein
MQVRRTQRHVIENLPDGNTPSRNRVTVVAKGSRVEIQMDTPHLFTVDKKNIVTLLPQTELLAQFLKNCARYVLVFFRYTNFAIYLDVSTL